MENGDKKYHILMVDDDRFLLDMYVNKFNKAGHKTETFFSGNEFLDRLKDHSLPKPDIILLDIVMPAIDGLDILEKIKNENLAPDSLIVMLTNQSEGDKVEKAKSLGVNGYVVKATSIPSEVVDMVIKIAEENGK